MIQFVQSHWVEIAGACYFIALLLTHLPETNPLNKVARYLLAGKLLKPPAA